MPNKSFFQSNSSEFLQQKSIRELQQDLAQHKECLIIAKEEFQNVSKKIDQMATSISHTEKKCLTIATTLLSYKNSNETNTLHLKKQQYENRLARQKQKLEPCITRQEQFAINIAQLEANTNALQTHLAQRKANAFNEAIAQAMQQQHPC